MNPRLSRGSDDDDVVATNHRCPVCSRRVATAPPAQAYCSVGCALAAGVPRDREGNFPITTPLIVALVFFFVAFNQILFAVLARIVAPDSVGLIRNLFLVSWGCGLTFWIGLAFMQLRVGARVSGDMLILVGTAALLLASWILESAGCASGGSLVLIAWGARGWYRGKSG